MSDLASTWAQVSGFEGWLREEQAAALWDLAAGVEVPGTIVEIGSYHGKSTIVLASASVEGVSLYAIDPHAGNDRGPGEWDGDPADGQADHEVFVENLRAAGLTSRITHVREFSQQATRHVSGPVDLLYIDGAHGYAPALSDIVDWGGRVAEGGTMAIHDTYTSVFVTLAVARSLWFSSAWRYAGRVRSLVVFRREPVRGLDRVSNTARQMASLGWFAKNVVVKALDFVGLHRLARLGHAPGGGVY